MTLMNSLQEIILPHPLPHPLLSCPSGSNRLSSRSEPRCRFNFNKSPHDCGNVSTAGAWNHIKTNAYAWPDDSFQRRRFMGDSKVKHVLGYWPVSGELRDSFCWKTAIFRLCIGFLCLLGCNMQWHFSSLLALKYVIFQDFLYHIMSLLNG